MNVSVPIKQTTSANAEEVQKRIRDAGERARAEAEVRRAAGKATPLAPERGGPAAPEPTRYGDWERKGLVSDF
jgi:hypothetical protein